MVSSLPPDAQLRAKTQGYAWPPEFQGPSLFSPQGVEDSLNRYATLSLIFCSALELEFLLRTLLYFAKEISSASLTITLFVDQQLCTSQMFSLST